MVKSGFMLPIFHKYSLNDLIMDTQLCVELGCDFLLSSLLG